MAKRTFIVSPNEVDDRVITDVRDFGPARRTYARLGPAIQQAIAIGRERMKRGRWKPVGVYTCTPVRANRRHARAADAITGGCSIVGYTSTDDHDHVIWRRY